MHLDRECGQAHCRKWYLALKVLRYAQTTVCEAMSSPGVSQNQGGGNREWVSSEVVQPDVQKKSDSGGGRFSNFEASLANLSPVSEEVSTSLKARRKSPHLQPPAGQSTVG